MSYVHYLVPAAPLWLPGAAELRRLADALFAGRFFVPSADDADHEPVVDQDGTEHLIAAPAPAEMAAALDWPRDARVWQEIDFQRYEHAPLKETPRDPLGIEDWYDHPGYFGAYEIAVVRHAHDMPHVLELNPDAGDRFACAACGVETQTTAGDAEGPTFPLGAKCGCGRRLDAENVTQDAMERGGFRARRVTPLLWRFALTVTPAEDPPDDLDPALDTDLVAAATGALGVPVVERGQRSQQ